MGKLGVKLARSQTHAAAGPRSASPGGPVADLPSSQARRRAESSQPREASAVTPRCAQQDAGPGLAAFPLPATRGRWRTAGCKVPQGARSPGARSRNVLWSPSPFLRGPVPKMHTL